MMVMNDSRYGHKLPFAICTIHIHAASKAMAEDEWDNMTLSWQSVALPACTSNASGMEDFSLKRVGGDVKVQKTTILSPFSSLLLKEEVQ